MGRLCVGTRCTVEAVCGVLADLLGHPFWSTEFQEYVAVSLFVRLLTEGEAVAL